MCRLVPNGNAYTQNIYHHTMSYTKVKKIYYNNHGKLCVYGAENNMRPLDWREFKFDNSQPELLSLYLDLISGCVQIVGINKVCNSISDIITEIKALHYARFTEKNKSIDMFGLYMLNCTFLYKHFANAPKDETLKYLLNNAYNQNYSETYRQEKIDMYNTYNSRYDELKQHTIDMYNLFVERISKILIKPVGSNVNINPSNSIQNSLFQ